MAYIRAFIWGGALAALLAAPFARSGAYVAIFVGAMVLLIVLAWARGAWRKRARAVIDPGIYSVTKPPTSVVTLNGDATGTRAPAPKGAPGSVQVNWAGRPGRPATSPGLTGGTAAVGAGAPTLGVTDMLGTQRQHKPNGLARLVCFLLGVLAVWWPQHQMLGAEVSDFMDDPDGYSQTRWGIELGIAAPPDGPASGTVVLVVG